MCLCKKHVCFHCIFFGTMENIAINIWIPHTNDLTRKLNNESDLKHQSLIMAPDVQLTL